MQLWAWQRHMAMHAPMQLRMADDHEADIVLENSFKLEPVPSSLNPRDVRLAVVFDAQLHGRKGRLCERVPPGPARADRMGPQSAVVPHLPQSGSAASMTPSVTLPALPGPIASSPVRLLSTT